MPTPREPGPDLFAAPQSDRKAEAPLAERMRPREFADYVGQEEITGSDRPLRKAIESDRLSSVIFWGPPGSGKTTLRSEEHTSELQSHVRIRMPSSA